MTKPLLSVVILGVITSLLLSLTNVYTRNRIEENRLYWQSETTRELLKDRGLSPPKNQDGNNPTCMPWQINKLEVTGYSGEIKGTALIENIDNQRVLSLRVTAHTETPGIGDFIEHRKTKWISALDGSSFEEWSNLDSVTGATITVSAMLDMAINAFQAGEVFCDIQ